MSHCVHLLPLIFPSQATSQFSFDAYFPYLSPRVLSPLFYPIVLYVSYPKIQLILLHIITSAPHYYSITIIIIIIIKFQFVSLVFGHHDGTMKKAPGA